ncbi:MAG TPA: asparagine synthetase B [Saprospiraceae bacterium]|nr:asparagine synthetase B [Saprospiraceae bacterium]HNL38253.1 asparagine synthetase B [Saprospiraceae bacterium]
MRKFLFIFALMALAAQQARATYILLPMDEVSQRNHLKAYGITYWVISQGVEAWWLLNYRGGSFCFVYTPTFEKECKTRGVSYEIIADAQYTNILNEIADPEVNMDAIKLEKAPKIAVYTPEKNEKGEEIQPWDDAVTMVLTYAEIPYDVIYDTEVLQGKLAEYDWLHLHHEDFTGMYGKFYASYHNQPWYRDHVRLMESLARQNGFDKVSEMKLAVAKKIREYVMGGGFMFAMCSATDTYDIALAANGVDICAEIYDGDPADPNAQSKLDFSQTLAFTDFQLIRDPLTYEHSTIDHNLGRNVDPEQDYFTLFDFSAKWDPVPTMLTQCHTRTVKGFMGQSTAFLKRYIKPQVLIMGENKPANEARYIHSAYGQGFFTFYGGHDPEDYRHFVGDPPTDLNLHPTSPGYRLILNNILFPAAKKKHQKT